MRTLKLANRRIVTDEEIAAEEFLGPREMQLGRQYRSRALRRVLLRAMD